MTNSASAGKLLMEKSLVVAPRAKIESISLVNSSIRSKLGVTVPSMQVDFGWGAKSTLDRDAKKLVVHAMLMVSPSL